MASNRTCCAAINCRNTRYRDQKSFFRFPKEVERCNRWRINCRNATLDKKSVQQLYNSCRLCSDHFELSQFMNGDRKSLIFNAVPSLFDVPNPPKCITVKRKKPKERSDTNFCQAKRRRLQSTLTICTTTTTSLPETFSPSADCSSTSEINHFILNKSYEVAVQSSFLEETTLTLTSASSTNSKCPPLPTTMSTSGPVKIEQAITPRKLELQSKLQYTRRSLDRCRKLLYRREKKINGMISEKPKECSGLCQKMESLPTNRRIFFENLINNELRSKQNATWKERDKMFALGMYYKSPAAYKYMKRHFNLPSIRTLNRFISKFRVQTDLTQVDIIDDGFDTILISDWTGMFKISDIDSNVVCYIAGYIAQKLQKNSSCVDCKNAYVWSRDAEKEREEIFPMERCSMIKYKQFEWAKNGLTLPDSHLYCLCETMEKTVQMNIERLGTSQGVLKYLKECVLMSTDLDSYHLDSFCCKHAATALHQVMTLYLRIRIHHFVRIRNRELKQMAQNRKEQKVVKRNRKCKKISHE